eukprot:TRINITY_DN11238_c0_g1_i2.p1 TRINITY_DN11238_c0_g1~~TRINITY_DN11238_c0_g1_i2.p1  ORF type:complete len:218 (+),score=42.27 TRINITY_DN11238_c0_g1_i2:85-738(+)
MTPGPYDENDSFDRYGYDDKHPTTPGTSYETPTTPNPGTLNSSEGSGSEPPTTPYASAPTPAVPMTPLTPSTGMPQTPLTPGSGLHEPQTPFIGVPDDESVDETGWCMQDIEVSVDDSFADGMYKDKRGVIKEVNDHTCSVMFFGSQDWVTIDSNKLRLVEPKKKDKVKVVQGPHKGDYGQLMGIDGVDGIVKMNEAMGFDIKILQMSHLGKIGSSD